MGFCSNFHLLILRLTCRSRWKFLCKSRPWLASRAPSGRWRKRSALSKRQWPSWKTSFTPGKWSAGASTTPSRSSRQVSMAGDSSTQLHEQGAGPFRDSIFTYFILYLQGNIRVFCRVRPLVDGSVSKHIQLPANDNKLITLAKTEEVRNAWARQSPQSWKENVGGCLYHHRNNLENQPSVFSVSHRQNYRNPEELQLQFWLCVWSCRFTTGGEKITQF